MDNFSKYLRERFKDDFDYAEKRGFERGKERILAKFIKNFHDKANMPFEQIAAIMEIPLDEAKSLYESATK